MLPSGGGGAMPPLYGPAKLFVETRFRALPGGQEALQLLGEVAASRASAAVADATSAAAESDLAQKIAHANKFRERNPAAWLTWTTFLDQHGKPLLAAAPPSTEAERNMTNVVRAIARECRTRGTEIDTDAARDAARVHKDRARQLGAAMRAQPAPAAPAPAGNIHMLTDYSPARAHARTAMLTRPGLAAAGTMAPPTADEKVVHEITANAFNRAKKKKARGQKPNWQHEMWDATRRYRKKHPGALLAPDDASPSKRRRGQTMPRRGGHTLGGERGPSRLLFLSMSAPDRGEEPPGPAGPSLSGAPVDEEQQDSDSGSDSESDQDRK